jgi:hypothetical protein
MRKYLEDSPWSFIKEVYLDIRLVTALRAFEYTLKAPA